MAVAKGALLTTKVHLAVDGRDLLLALVLMPGNVIDSTMFQTVMDAVRIASVMIRTCWRWAR
ncbi:hypothetical protein [Streptomyces sp. NBC_01497]|uniref:hypothetical protein n=1 Tax=Streptomyces sp. NBC_01497 TaxID=2903885 RepID=UPI003FCC973D